MADIRQLGPGDEAEAEAFLEKHADSSMLLRSNIARGGLIYRGQPFQGTYMALFEDGRIAALAGHGWTGRILLQTPVSPTELLSHLMASTSRPITGFMGPCGQAMEVKAWLGPDKMKDSFESRERLMALDLANLDLAPVFGRGLECRLPLQAEVDLIGEWRGQFYRDLLHVEMTEEDFASDRAMLDLLQDGRRHWILTNRGRPVSYAGFNAALPDAVQLAWVWTPPGDRDRGFGRAVVAGALAAAREKGVGRGVLTVNPENIPAIKAYQALGFQDVGDYCYLLFK